MTHKFIRIICLSCQSVFDVPVYCGDRFCSVCSYVRRMRVQARLQFLVKNLKPLPGYNLKHLTLTIKNQQNLSLMTATIVKSFRKLRQTASWKAHVSGGAYVIDITGSSSDWHVHLHIMIQSKYYKWDTLLKLWMKLSPGRGVYIQDISKQEVIRHMVKYISKSPISDDDRDELNAALKGSRLFQVFGSWYAINLQYKPPPKHCNNCNNPCFCVYSDFVGDMYPVFEKEI